jgi:hypothetical protein
MAVVTTGTTAAQDSHDSGSRQPRQRLTIATTALVGGRHDGHDSHDGHDGRLSYCRTVVVLSYGCRTVLRLSWLSSGRLSRDFAMAVAGGRIAIWPLPICADGIWKKCI